MMLRYSTIILLSSFAVSFSQTTADVLILSRPQDYTIFNQYQQPLSESERSLFVANVPLQIVKENEIMGDQITHALRFVFEGKTWFVERDESGNFAGDKGKQFRQVLKKCLIISDTVQIMAEGAVSFSEKFPPGAKGWLRKGETVQRLFSYGGFFYVKRPAEKPPYGWSRFGVKTGWKRIEQGIEKPQELTTLLMEQIMDRFKAANRTYEEYFSHFDKLTGQEKTIPRWRCEAKGDEVHCSLNAPYDGTSQLDESTQYLVRDLENMLIGKQYEVLFDKGGIFIKPRSQGRDKP